LPPEPDLARDFLARPESERIAPAPAWRAGAGTRLLAGPDSALARLLIAGAARGAADRTDLVPERSRWALAQARGGRLAEPLIERMASPDWRVRAYAAWALGYSGDARAVPPLMAAAGEPNWRLRAMSVAALEKLDDPRAYPVMRRALRDPAWQVRVNAVEYLGRIPGAGGRGLTRAHLNDRHSMVREVAARVALGER
ncbi:MAG TPA: HEAT repeat domain-containing protein, partial [Longimicrobium sp.]